MNATTERRPLLGRVGAFFFAWRNWVFTAILLGLLIILPPVPFGGRQTDLLLNLIGLAITLAGQALRIVVIGQTPIRSGGTGRRVDAERLVTTGLLRHVRNPLYIGNLLVLIGLILIHNNPWVYALLLPAALFAYHAIVTNEEAFLVQRFGAEYQDYCRRVRRWLPDLRGVGESLRQVPIDWRRVMLQEYGSIYLAVALPLLLMIYEQAVMGNPASRGASVRTLALLWVLATVAWIWFRRIKLAEVARRRLATTETRSNS